MTVAKKTFQYGKHRVVLDTGTVARQATAAVLVDMDDTVVLVTVVGSREIVEGRDFFPLTVNYTEKTYAAGKIPGGYHKREAKPPEKDVLTSRLIDRPIRPLFADGFMQEVQVIATVMSLNPEVNPDIPAMIGASAALSLSGMPFNGPIGAARVGYKDGQYTLNPGFAETEESELELIVAGTKDAVLMVESEAKELTEEVMLGAVLYGHEQMQVVIDAINELKEVAGKPAWNWQPPATDKQMRQEIEGFIRQDLEAAYQIHDKVERYSRLEELQDKVLDQFCPEDSDEIPDPKEVLGHVSKIGKEIVREQILSGRPRIDGRDLKTVRPISVQTGILPRAHGSALFTRGETQAIVVTTLGTGRDAQIVDALEGERKDAFMLHYNFPPFSVGEVGFMGAPKRREIGHGNLARRATVNMLPSDDEFPYVLRVVSEITESNGSSSMATVCGTSLSLMDAGVPVKDQVAGIAMGLVKEGERFAVLTDILGDEDHLGDMDFKVAGTSSGVTALQMDIKIEGITKEIMEKALNQAKEGRLHILNIMNEAISKPREEMSDYAPRIINLIIHPDKIRDVIGKGGATIRELIETTGVTSIDITDEGVVSVASVDNIAAQKAITAIERITADVEVGATYEGKVIKLVDFGAFVNILPGKDGLVHISQISEERINNIQDVLSEGQIVQVKVLEVDRQGRIRLSMKALHEDPEAQTE